MKINLIQSRELFGPPDRQEELRKCWALNDGLFNKYTKFKGRPTFTELFDMCEPGYVNVICNSDIFIPEETCALLESMEFDPRQMKCFALSRWDVLPNGDAKLWDHRDSQDVWIISGGPWLVDAPYPMGVAGCDNALVHALQLAGFTVTNPSKTIKTYHLHNVNYRSYLVDHSGIARGGDKIERVPPPYAFVQPTEL